MSRRADRYQSERGRGPNRRGAQQSPGKGAEEPTEPQAKIAPFKPRGENQIEYVRSLYEYRLTFALGPAGTGKSYVAASIAAKLLADKSVKSLILCRPAVEAGEEHLGFLPGDLSEKMAPWTAPIIDILYQRLGKQRVDGMVRAGVIKTIPFAYMRGWTLQDAFVLLDEAQNTTPSQMKLFLTRIGEGATVSVNGDTKQSDIHSEDNGLATAIWLATRFNIPCGVIKFTPEDCVRSEMCRAWSIAFEEDEDHIDNSLPFLRAS